ncbi:g-type lectin s-receptor-like serinethreonine-protein kinase rlk1 [Nicotiana attenuata]|uniref:G-type lectin s-receptor-like serinethreonine-protein kinase rlk1 n=1 Tax=Nicotiana attenuata TaxID=49451 RepID=A0A1J6KGL4_NICAT|nr:g-type lectin s-receptor-like serinethreonine-protein kinase rlk1 [Nicotiana attenuata]
MGNDSTDPLWESFRNPIDTLLPNQILERGSFLVSQRSEVFDENGMMYVLKRNNQRQYLTPRSIPSASGNYHRVTLNFDGVLTHYYHSRSSNSSGWNILWSQPDNICVSINGDKGTGACGYNNVCSLGTNNRPVCNCPQGYSLLDPNDVYGDCKQDFIQSCHEIGRGSPEDVYNIVTVRDIAWPTSDFRKISPSTEQDCQRACLNDCFCAVAIYKGISCWKKKLPMSNGRIDASLKSIGFIKVRKDGVPPLSPGLPNPGSRQSKNWRNWAVVSSTLLDSICHSFTYRELVEATADFKEELGRGAFGIVYKGVMPISSRNVVAIKKLDRVAQKAEKEKEFMAERRTLTNIRGTRGYVAPEWFRNSQVTVKVDVYSFGVLLLEIITCRKSLENEESYGSKAILTDWVLDCFQEGKLEALAETDTEALNDKKQLERFVMVGIWCIQEDSSMRSLKCSKDQLKCLFHHAHKIPALLPSISLAFKISLIYVQSPPLYVLLFKYSSYVTRFHV